MTDGGLFALYHLHQVDEAIQALRAQAAALDTGAAELAEAKRLAEASDGPSSELHALKAEQYRFETEQGTLQGKAQKLDAALLDGTVHSEKDRAAVAAELESVRSRIGNGEDRLLELLEAIPSAEAAAKSEMEQIESLKVTAASKMREAKVHHAEIKTRFEALLATRAGLASNVPDRLLKKYEPIRAKKGVGMGMVTDDHRCSVCASAIAEKVRDAVRRDEVQTCEQCGRILFRLEQHA
ncbi:MAG: zinc ribbon domain-containing protein [Fimbriimonadaceae bacterium]